MRFLLLTHKAVEQMDHKVPYGSCESSLDLFIYNYFSFLNGAHVEPYRIFCI